MKFKILTSLLLVVLINTSSFAQDYKSAVGVRGPFSGVFANYKTYLSEKGGLDLSAGFNYGYYDFGNFDVNAAYQYDVWKVPFLEGLNLHVGGGVYAYIWTGSYKGTYNSLFNAGLMGNVGWEYTFAKIPLNLSVEYSPGFTIIGGKYADEYDQFGVLADLGRFTYHGGVTARYILSR